MPSENESKTPPTKVDERRAKIARLLEEYVVKIGIGKILPTNEVEKYLNLTQPELRKMSAEDCGEAAYLIAKSMTYIQLEINRIQADINWCENFIQWTVAKIIQTVGGQYTPFDYKRTLAIQQNDATSAAHKAIVEAKLRIDAMAFITNQLRMVAQTLEGLQQTKRSQK